MVRDLSEHARRRLKSLREHLALTPEARRAARRDRKGLPESVPDHDAVIREGLGWLLRAQASSETKDGGVARHYSFVSGWSASYPETTGYIVPTLLEHADATGNAELEAAALRMLDFLLSIQLDDGSWPGGMVGQEPQRPVTFNTGQILLGVAFAAARDPRYLASMERAADWLVDTQDPDGAWRSHPSPFAPGGDKVFDTHIAWGLLEAARVSGDPRHAAAARANIEWAMGYQTPSGWFENCCLNNVVHPLTHTIGYALRGIVEGYRYFRDDSMLRSAVLAADALGDALGPDGYLPGRFDRDWQPRGDSACLTGTSQIAICWLLLHVETGNERYLSLARRANAYVRRTVLLDGPPEVRGGVKGSHPVWGDYGRYQLLNWACKFTVDANQLELEVEAGRQAAP